MPKSKKDLPVMKKKISDYIMGEEGRISKQSLMAMGAFLGSAALGSILFSDDVAAQETHINSLTLGYSGGNATATHSHHASHSSY